MKWRNLSGGQRVGLLVAAVIVLNLLLILVGTATGTGEPPASSAASTDGNGLSGYAALLKRAGHKVELIDQRLTATNLKPDGTLIVSDPGFVEGVEADAIRSFVDKGGRVVLLGRTTAPLARRLGEPRDLRWRPVPPNAGPAHAVVPVPEVNGVDYIEGATGAWQEVGNSLPVVVNDDGDTTAFVGLRNDGVFAVVADSGPFQNDHLANSDNAAFGLALAGGPERPVTFVQPRTGSTGFGAIPLRWRLSALVLVLAVSLALWARGKRTIVPGPAQLIGPSRVDYVHALGALLAKSAAHAPVQGPLGPSPQKGTNP